MQSVKRYLRGNLTLVKGEISDHFSAFEELNLSKTN